MLAKLWGRCWGKVWELGYSEFDEAWRFLNRPGTEVEIDVDVGIIDGSEFTVALMEEKALRFTPFADLETLSTSWAKLQVSFHSVSNPFLSSIFHPECTIPKTQGTIILFLFFNSFWKI